MVTARPGDDRRREAERSRMGLLWQIVDDLDAHQVKVAEAWSPPMTAEGRHVQVAREIEARLRALWEAFVSSAPPPFRRPYAAEDPLEHAQSEAAARSEATFNRRRKLKASLRRIVESDDAFDLFPLEAHDELRQLQHLLAQIVEEQLG